ncbi:MAG: DUF2147 domain-containing protein [Bacteroidia bacterium]|nr:DUF2147 domain-containing protein [Bacteroidia bacterium]
MNYTILFAILSILFSVNSPTIEGKWKTIDDETGKAKSIVEIYKKSDGKYYGKIVELLIKPKHDKCVECSGSKKNQPLIGLEIVEGLVKKGNEWVDGNITDPKTGKTYSCEAKINKKGNLEIRGYIGFSLLGRTQTWIRQ